jgi:hypothetical protein
MKRFFAWLPVAWPGTPDWPAEPPSVVGTGVAIPPTGVSEPGGGVGIAVDVSRNVFSGPF